MKAALVQYSQNFENIQENREKLDSLLGKSISDEDLLVFPEMTLTGYTMNSEKFAEDEEGESLRYLSGIASVYKKHVVAGYIEKNNGSCYNTLVHFNRVGEITARYRKIHLFSYAGENSHYTPGTEAVETKIEDFNTGVSICYDLRFPELFREYAKKRSSLIICIASWPVKRIHHWKMLLRARAVENQCYVIGVNRTGIDPFNKYNGCSGVFDPLGEELFMAEDRESVITCELNISLVDEVRHRYRFLDDISMI
jgi:omega-amidase